MKSAIILLLLLCYSICSTAQPKKPQSETLPLAKEKQTELYTFDIARPIEHFDATPSADLWYAVDKFTFKQTMTINGIQLERHFNEIPLQSTSISPNGKYLVWMGLDRSFDPSGFNTTTTSIFKFDLPTHRIDSIGSFTSDHNMLFFSPKCPQWAAVLPAASVVQGTTKDVILLDGKVVATGNPNPRKFTFSKDCQGWAYRSTDGVDENIITNKGKQLFYKRSRENPFVETDDPVILHLSPEMRTMDYAIEARDFDFGLPNTAHLYKTSYLLSAKDTNHVYLVYNGKRQFTSRWISDVVIDSSGKHIIYFANDTAKSTDGKRHESRGLMVRDGKVIGGPYDAVLRLFLSPSGEHTVWTVLSDSSALLFNDGKPLGSIGEFSRVIWSKDESKIAYLTADNRKKLYVVAGGKRGPNFDMVGRIAFTADGKAVEYAAVKYDKLLHIVQPL